MFKLLSLSCALVLFSTSSVWADDAKKTDKEKLQGTWQVTKGMSDGKELPKEMNAKVKIVISTDKLTIYPPDGDGTESFDNVYQIDESKTPKTIKIKKSKNADQIEREYSLGIYKLNGDTLTICMASRPGKERPTKFEAAENSGYILLTLKRVKK